MLSDKNHARLHALLFPSVEEKRRVKIEELSITRTTYLNRPERTVIYLEELSLCTTCQDYETADLTAAEMVADIIRNKGWA